LSMIGRQIRITACMNIFFIISFVSLYGFIISTSMHQTIIKKLKGKGGVTLPPFAISLLNFLHGSSGICPFLREVY
jgi:hypothetical protein